MNAMRHTRWIVRSATIATLAAAFVLTAATTTEARPQSRAVVNQAVAVDTHAGRHSSRLAWMVRNNVGGALPSNYAKAQTWCNDCHTTAIALQVVLMSRVTGPTASWNHSVAANSKCTRCSTASAAFQFAVISNGTVTLTPSGTAQLNALRAEMQQIAGSGAAPADINAAATGVAIRVLGVLQRELRSDAAPAAAQGFVTMAATRPYEIRYQHDADAATA
jgi:hypothetical protein